MSSTLSVNNRPVLLEKIIPIACEAGKAIMAIYNQSLKIDYKADNSPVTQADKDSEKIILAGLDELNLGISVISEEAAAAGKIPKIGRRFVLVDPLDGTRELVADVKKKTAERKGEFTVNISLIEDGLPVLGVVYAPALGKLFAGCEGHGAFFEENGARRRIQCRGVPEKGLTLVVSRSHNDEDALGQFLAGKKIADRKEAGSSLKFCLIAAGEADLYPRTGTTMEWDTAAGHAVLLAAGGGVDTFEGGPLRYGKPDYKNAGFVARGYISIRRRLPV